MDFGTARGRCNTYGSGHVLPGELPMVHNLLLARAVPLILENGNERFV